jgi:predicted acyl esterase
MRALCSSEVFARFARSRLVAVSLLSVLAFASSARAETAALGPTADKYDVEVQRNVRVPMRDGVDVYSSNFPNFDINPNTGDPNDRRPRIANNTLHHDAAHASFVELPIAVLPGDP